jgi:N6-L-threonylcarbamoyladenine synthase
MAMRILAIETSCDETGIAVLETGPEETVILSGNALASQIAIHAEFGGVFPALAKRAHAEHITGLIQEALDEAELLEAVDTPHEDIAPLLSFLDEKETTLKEHLTPFFTYYKKPDIDYIAVTVGPGLEPALWVGVNTARALAAIWNIPVIPINHMEGHVVTAVFQKINERSFVLSPIDFPLLSLLVSGGHTELVVSEQFGSYEKIGMTRDDAVGEAFDKVARMLGLPYPGGPALSALAKEYRLSAQAGELNGTSPFALPRPMLHSGDFDFSFSGIKTAVLYGIRDLTQENTRELTDDEKKMIACAFEDAVVEVLIKKTLDALETRGAQTLIVGGGVAGNTHLQSELVRVLGEHTPETTLLFPEQWLATDNAVMIGMAAMLQVLSGNTQTSSPENLKADGNLSL